MATTLLRSDCASEQVVSGQQNLSNMCLSVEFSSYHPKLSMLTLPLPTPHSASKPASMGSKLLFPFPHLPRGRLPPQIIWKPHLSGLVLLPSTVLQRRTPRNSLLLFFSTRKCFPWPVQNQDAKTFRLLSSRPWERERGCFVFLHLRFQNSILH